MVLSLESVSQESSYRVVTTLSLEWLSNTQDPPMLKFEF